ncbi:hypothetical protein LTR91_003604 [Friedmanniomyces endolithicus]|uniref:Monopolin complex subunit Csm1/Pcs1 C-terminal domain-containing protein n=1 Tax=Friedmanniomyces endolithicus TaxID=329885 RepID=A0AAN6JIG4_9PEZI|nr:hypothetical protein LTR35_015734 [Friedmanniomyces endolithicus]KAK0293361.1 hypothetical protein LTS00_007607 [Friedmanniomyces endolithicus]KAK0302899.1 hypothetical protein LTR01_008454 [Friedmanniomyces endolithicus]KAK0325570.1 hypothetical protein LTR82_003105 [Friedmanniomyces endolithicus]KAK0829744.1 hypothetical protein LTR73_003879 [Friedmanniomyces endolithicus]
MAAQNSLLNAGASDSEDDLATATANGTRKVAKSRTVAQKAMPAAKKATKRKQPTKQPRQVLKDRTNIPSDAEDMEDENTAGGKPRAKRAKTAPARKPRTKAGETMGVIPETQMDPADVEQSIEMEVDDVVPEVAPQQIQRIAQRATSVQPVQLLQPRPSARSVSAQPGFPPPRERSGSFSGTERERRGGDPETRRKMKDLTKRYEDLEAKYHILQDTGKDGAESNFEKLKRATDEKARDANALIASLKKEIVEVRQATNNTAELTGLQKQVSTLNSTNEKLTTDSSTLKEKFQTSQNEVKSLEAKLVAARQQLSNGLTQESSNKALASQTGKAPSSQTALGRSVNGSALSNATDAQKEAKMKENLYSDLTGLIIRGVKRNAEGEDEYDCIQTGRNGTLHFHLSIALTPPAITPASSTSGSNANTKQPSAEDTEFSYEPLLDPSRDEGLLELLPDYLAEDICFPRSHAVKFYGKVVECMTRRVVVEEEGDGE